MTHAHLDRYRGFLAKRPLVGPETVHLDVTNTCNLDCVTCWNYGATLETPKSVAWKRQHVDSADFLRVLDEVATLGAERIVLSGGGEPFTHPDIERLIAAVKAKGLRLTIITNGTLCDFERLAALRVDQLLLNVASASPQTYVAYHPNQPRETFQRLMAGVERLRGVTAVNMVQVINALNAFELVAMVELAATLGARVSFKVADTPKGTELFALTPSLQQQLLAEWVPAARRTAKALGVKHNLDAYEAQLRRVERKPPTCFAGYLYSRVAVDGRVFFCCAHIDVGRLSATQSFGEVWASPTYQALREKLDAGVRFAACERCGKHDMNFAAEAELEALLAEGVLERHV